MYDRFTEPARQVMQLANQEAIRLEHEYIAPEHIEAGLLKIGECGAIAILKQLSFNLQKALADEERILQSLPVTPPGTSTIGKPRAKSVVEFAMLEARSLHHNYVGTPHLLLGLLQVVCDDRNDAFAQQNLTVDAVREQIKKTMPDADPPLHPNLL